MLYHEIMHDFHIFFNFYPFMVCNRNNEKEKGQYLSQNSCLSFHTLLHSFSPTFYSPFLFLLPYLETKWKNAVRPSLSQLLRPWIGMGPIPCQIIENQAVLSNRKGPIQDHKLFLFMGTVRCWLNWAIRSDIVYHDLSNFLCNTIWNHIQQITSFNHLSFLLQCSVLVLHFIGSEIEPTIKRVLFNFYNISLAAWVPSPVFFPTLAHKITPAPSKASFSLYVEEELGCMKIAWRNLCQYLEEVQ